VVDLNSLCECGHTVEDHHNPMLCDGLVYDHNAEQVPFDPATHTKGKTASIRTSWHCLETRTDFPHVHAEECEHWGFNETGGLQPLGPKGKHLNWIQDPDSTYSNSFILDDKIVVWVDHCRAFVLAEK